MTTEQPHAADGALEPPLTLSAMPAEGPSC